LIIELGSRLAIVAALLSGFLLYQPAGNLIASFAEIGVLAPIVGFIFAAALAFIIVRLLSHSLQTIIESARLQFLDKLLGLVFGLMEGLVIIILILLVLHYQTFFDTASILRDSIIAGILLPIISASLPAANQQAMELLRLSTSSRVG